VLTINPHEEEGNTNFSELTTLLGSSRATPSHLGDWIPKSNRRNEVIEGDGDVLLLEGGTLKEAQIFYQGQELRLES
jgi:hypothetical protein